ncbi:MAG: TlpA family protein disulfide reductase [Tannerella sp.]|jgi:peroxiredoxin|nr:TlpA family protein disulfide reductase [Tannerella sp.]
MKRNRILWACIPLFLSFSGKAQDTTDIVTTGDPMPAFTIVSDNGVETSSATFEGKVILINFFATWCPPCQVELAEMENVLWPKYKDEANFVLLVIGREHSDAELTTYNEKKGFTFPLYPDKDRKIYASFATQLIPRSYLIDKTGKILFVAKGFNKRDFERIQRMINNSIQ